MGHESGWRSERSPSAQVMPRHRCCQLRAGTISDQIASRMSGVGPLIVRGDRHAGVLARKHDAELPVDAVHSPCSVPDAQPNMATVAGVVRMRSYRASGTVLSRGRRVGDHRADIRGRDERSVLVPAFIEQGAAESGDLLGAQCQRARVRRAGHQPQPTCSERRWRSSRSGHGCRPTRAVAGQRPHRPVVLLGTGHSRPDDTSVPIIDRLTPTPVLAAARAGGAYPGFPVGRIAL